MGRLSWAVVALALSAWCQPALKPTFRSEVLAPEESLILPLLKAACGDGVRTVDMNGQRAFGCGDGSMDEILAARSLKRHQQWMPYVLWQAGGVIFGNFLSPTSEDAAVSCVACEGHGLHFGGTLLLTKKSGEWEPVWYQAGAITRHCRRLTLASGRQILFCEDTDAGMGHRLHSLYTVQFARSQSDWDRHVLVADSYDSTLNGGVQAQALRRVVFQEDGPGRVEVRVHAQHGRIAVRPGDERKTLPVPRVGNYEIAFRPVDDRFQVVPASAPAARLFGVGQR